MKRYRIALVTDKYLPIFGGLEILLRDLAHELTLRGHEVHVISATPGGPDDAIFDVSRLDVPRLLYRARSTVAVRKLEAVLRAGRFDLVHAHCIFSPLAHAATFLARRLGIASVFTLHSDLRGAGAIAARALHALTRWGRWPTVLTAVSRYVAGELRAVTARDDVELLLNAAHVDRWQAACPAPSAADAPGVLRIAAAMRFTLRKRPIDLVRMMPALQARLQRALWPKLMIIGDGPELPSVRREVARLGLGAHVELPGYLPHDAMAAALAPSTLFAVPSHREALSIAAIEARAAGLPVVARIPSGVAEVVEHGKHGFLASSTGEFVDAMAALVREPSLRARMSAHAREDLERFTWPRCIARHEAIYALAVARHAG